MRVTESTSERVAGEVTLHAREPYYVSFGIRRRAGEAPRGFGLRTNRLTGWFEDFQATSVTTYTRPR